MLVLSRFPNERIIITTPEGRVITITNISVKGDKVRIGIQADREVIVDRAEVAEEKRQQRTGAKPC